MPSPDTKVSAKFGNLQSLDDAIAYRLGKLRAPCPACDAQGSRCPEHWQDEQLIASYQDQYAAAFQDALTGMDPADIELIMQPGDNLPPTVAALSVAILARLREMADDGPFVLDLEDGPVVIELDGPAIIEHPLLPGSDGS